MERESASRDTAAKGGAHDGRRLSQAKDPAQVSSN